MNWSGTNSAAAPIPPISPAKFIARGRSDLSAAVRQHSRNARRLLASPELRDDVAFALQRDTVPFAAELKNGAVVRVVEARAWRMGRMDE